MLLFISVGAIAQTNEQISLQLNLIDKAGFSHFPNLIVVNKSTGYALYNKTEPNFTVKIGRNDTLLIGALGYQTKTYFYRKRSDQLILKDTVVLEKLNFELNAFSVFAERNLNEIHEELETLGFDKKDYILSGLDAINSPITFLYQSLSKRGKRELRAREIILEDRRREVLKELFKQYVDADIIRLNTNEFDEFIDFCTIPDQVMLNSTQYEFIMYIKGCYQAYRYYRK